MISRFPGVFSAIDARTVEQLPAAAACQQAISESFAMLPVQVFRKVDESTHEPAPDHPLSPLLRRSPNDFQDSMQWLELMVNSCLDFGNCYSHLQRSRTEILQIRPLLANTMKVDVVEDNGGIDRLIFVRRLKSGGEERFPAEEILHLPVNTTDGIQGRPVWQVTGDTFRMAKALQDHGISLFENGTLLDFVLETDQTFKDDESRKNFLKHFNESLKQLNNAALLEAGVKVNPLNMTLTDAQFQELRNQYNVAIAQVYRMPPVLIQMMDKGMSFASVEQLAIFFINYTIQPWATRFEKAMDRQLLHRYGDTEHFIKFNIKALLRGDMLNQTQAIVQRLQNGLLSINEARRIEDMNPIDGGEEYWVQANNMQPVSQIVAPEPDAAPPAQQEQPTEASIGYIQPRGATENTAEIFVDGTQSNATAGAPEGELDRIVDEVLCVLDETEDGLFDKRLRPLFDDAAFRVINKEVKAAKAATKKNFAIWAENFYPKHRDFFIDALWPAVRAVLSDDRDPLERVADTYIRVRQDQILGYLKSEFHQETARDLISDWRKDIPEVVDAIYQAYK
ncbi:MAG: phage portal protein [Candidatus Latescibacteria bacterium]|nr:phage portal protein [Candidatus Latescibacterota bacterium]NIO78050.1 phage portal protein [Candidatus Latescibacterota bacterium]